MKQSMRFGTVDEDIFQKFYGNGAERRCKQNLDLVIYHGLNTREDRDTPFLPKTILSFPFTSPNRKCNIFGEKRCILRLPHLIHERM